MKSNQTKVFFILLLITAIAAASFTILYGADCTASNSCGVECDVEGCSDYRCWSHDYDGGGVGCVCDNVRVLVPCEGDVTIFVQ